MAPKKSTTQQKGGSEASKAVEALMTPADYARMERLLQSGGSSSGPTASAAATVNGVLQALSPQGVAYLHNVVSKPLLQNGGALKDVLTGVFAKLRGGQQHITDDNMTKLGGILFGKAAQKGGAKAVRKTLKDVKTPRRMGGGSAPVAGDTLRNIPALRSQDLYNAYILNAKPAPSYPNP
jgi:hypothetical protein